MWWVALGLVGLVLYFVYSDKKKLDEGFAPLAQYASENLVGGIEDVDPDDQVIESVETYGNPTYSKVN
jgi:hypothetical protein